MATTSFNHAMDFLGMDQEASCEQWAAKAMSLAHYCQDGGELEKVLHKNYASLNLDRQVSGP